MAASNTVTLRFIGDTRDLDKSFRTVQGSVDQTQSKFGKFASALKPMAIAAGSAIAVHFGRASIDAFKESQDAQTRLQDAFRRFPALADTNIKALQKLNEQLAKKTRFDDDATASGQAVLASFKLTGDQVLAMTPLLQDYAAKTGKDLPTAAADLGKALQGQGRALKTIGLEFQDTGTFAGNLDLLMSGLRTQVGGFAETEGKTAAGQAEILKNKFGELQEKVGAALLPILQTLAEKLIALIDWFEGLDPPVQKALIGLGGLAIIAGPLVGLIDNLAVAVGKLGLAFNWLGKHPLIIAIGAGIALGVILNKLIETHFPAINRALESFGGMLYDVATGGFGAVTDAIRSVISWLDKAIDKVGAFVKKIRDLPGGGGLIDTGKSIAKNLIPGAGFIPGLASGGIVRRPTLAMIGEAGPEAVVPLGRGGGMGTTNVTVIMPPGANGDDVVSAIKRYENRNGSGWRN